MCISQATCVTRAHQIRRHQPFLEACDRLAVFKAKRRGLSMDCNIKQLPDFPQNNTINLAMIPAPHPLELLELRVLPLCAQFRLQIRPQLASVALQEHASDEPFEACDADVKRRTTPRAREWSYVIAVARRVRSCHVPRRHGASAFTLPSPCKHALWHAASTFDRPARRTKPSAVQSNVGLVCYR